MSVTPEERERNLNDHTMCRQIFGGQFDGACLGQHCVYCGKSCSSQGHAKCQEEAGNG